MDDGSTDNTAEIIKLLYYPQVSVLRLEANQGKASAVLKGAKETDCEYVLLADGDLQNIVVEEFTQAVLAIRSNPYVDMLILRRINKDPLTRLLRGDIMITGERIVRRADLLGMLTGNRVEGFQLEVALNQYMLDENKIVRWLPVSSTGVISYRKLGFWQGVKKEIQMFTTIFSYIGIKYLMQQFLFLGRQRL